MLSFGTWIDDPDNFHLAVLGMSSETLENILIIFFIVYISYNICYKLLSRYLKFYSITFLLFYVLILKALKDNL